MYYTVILLRILIGTDSIFMFKGWDFMLFYDICFGGMMLSVSFPCQSRLGFANAGCQHVFTQCDFCIVDGLLYLIACPSVLELFLFPVEQRPNIEDFMNDIDMPVPLHVEDTCIDHRRITQPAIPVVHWLNPCGVL